MRGVHGCGDPTAVYHAPFAGAKAKPSGEARLPDPVLLSWFLIAASPFVGSFVATFAVRWPEGRGVIAGRSRCPACAAPLGPLDLVPLLSWLAAGGRCRHCGTRLSRLYPAVELSALVATAAALLAAPPALAPFAAGLTWLLLLLAVTDLRAFLLPMHVTYLVAAAGLLAPLLRPGQLPVALADAAIGLFAGAAGLLLVRAAYGRLAGREGLGLGDVRLAGAAGAWVGWQGLPLVVLAACATGLVQALLQRPEPGVTLGRRRVPFGAGLAFGTWLVWVANAAGAAV